MFEPWGDGDQLEPAFLDDDLVAKSVEINESVSHSNELNGEHHESHTTMDDRNSQPQHVVNEGPKDGLLELSLLTDVESNLVKKNNEQSEEMEFLDFHQLEEAIDSLWKGTSNLAVDAQMRMDQPASYYLNDDQARMQDEMSGDHFSSQIGFATEDEQRQLNSTIDLDTEELYSDIASLDLTSLKDPPVYSVEPIEGAQNPDPIILADLVDEGESDDEGDEPVTQPLDVALQRHQHDFGPVQGTSSMLQVDEDPGDPICSISIPTSDVQHKDHHEHAHKHGEDSGSAHQDGTSTREEAWDAAQDVLKTFGLTEGSPIKEEQCEGHKETIFGVSFSECGTFCATASQDATIKVWDVRSNALLASLEGHSKDFECLRVAWASSSWFSKTLDRTCKFQFLLASGGADGTVRLWACQDPRIAPGQEGGWQCYLTSDHSHFSSNNSTNNKPQIYTLDFIDRWEAFDTSGEGSPSSFLMTSSNDYLHFWSLDALSTSEPDRRTLKEVISLQFGSIAQYGYGVSVANVTEGDHSSSKLGGDSADSLGGERNPSNVVYVFDASFCPPNGLVGVALSDGTLRLINGRGICVCILNVPNSQSHLTSCAWDRHGSRLVTTVATGQLVSWHLLLNNEAQGSGYTKADHVCTFEGGHEANRPLFGARYYAGDTEELIISWSVDGSLCLWDSKSQGHVKSPIAVLRHYGHSIYAVEVHANQSIAVGGAASSCCSHGVPLYLYQTDGEGGERTQAMEDIDYKPCGFVGH